MFLSRMVCLKWSAFGGLVVAVAVSLLATEPVAAQPPGSFSWNPVDAKRAQGSLPRRGPAARPERQVVSGVLRPSSTPLAVSPAVPTTDRTIAVRGSDGRVRVFEVESGSTAGPTVGIRGTDGRVRVFQVETNLPSRPIVVRRSNP